jgi:hypothetical protein
MPDLPTKPVEVLPPIDLRTLAIKINAAHKAVVDGAKSALTNAIAAGEALIAAKAAVADGTWLRWLRDNCTVSERTAQLYMQVAENKRQLEIEATNRSATIADQTLNEAIRSLRARKPTKKKPKQEEPPKSVVLGSVDAPHKQAEPTIDDYITNTAADELFPILRQHYDAEQLTKLADLISNHLAGDIPAPLDRRQQGGMARV